MKAKPVPPKRQVRKKAKAPRPVPTRASKKESTKERILDAALEMFRKHGLHGTTTKRISSKAGIAEGTLFNYFKTKEDLALFFFQREIHSLIEWYHGEKRLREAPLSEKLFAIIHRQLEYLAVSENFIGEVFFRALEPKSRLSPLSLESQELRVKYLKFIRDVLAEATENGEIPPVGDLGAHVVGLFYLGIVAHWLNDLTPGKQRTLALLDRGLQWAVRLVRKGGWEW
jgi:AcrR family transcriptional regulator